MNESRLPLIQHFISLRDNPKWGIKLLLAVVITSLSSVISVYATDLGNMYKGTEMTSNQIEQTETITKIGSIIGSPFISLITIGITFLVILIISKLMKSQAIAKSILSATLSYTIITGGIALIIIVIQWIAGLSPTDYNIASLNIFDKGNSILGVINLQTLIGAYVFGIMLFATNNFSKKSSVIWAILYIIVFGGFGLIGAIFQ